MSDLLISGISHLIHLIEKKRLGCLYGKTVNETQEYFESLLSFIRTDKQFFKEQYQDLTLSGKGMFLNYLIKNNILEDIENLYNTCK